MFQPLWSPPPMLMLPPTPPVGWGWGRSMLTWWNPLLYILEYPHPPCGLWVWGLVGPGLPAAIAKPCCTPCGLHSAL